VPLDVGLVDRKRTTAAVPDRADVGQRCSCAACTGASARRSRRFLSANTLQFPGGFPRKTACRVGWVTKLLLGFDGRVIELDCRSRRHRTQLLQNFRIRDGEVELWLLAMLPGCPPMLLERAVPICDATTSTPASTAMVGHIELEGLGQEPLPTPLCAVALDAGPAGWRGDGRRSPLALLVVGRVGVAIALVLLLNALRAEEGHARGRNGNGSFSGPGLRGNPIE